MGKSEALKLFAGRRASYIYCGVCGHTPQTELDEPNRGPITWWDVDDGWKIGTLCRYCWMDVCDTKPKLGDFAYESQAISVENTDEDPTIALLGDWF